MSGIARTSAALGTLVLRASENELFHRQLFGTIKSLEERVSRLFGEHERLKQELAEAKLELKLERQTRFATNEQKQAEVTGPPADNSVSTVPKKRGAPVGHPGWFRPTPAQYDWAEDVPAPKRCPHCHVRTVMAG